LPPEEHARLALNVGVTCPRLARAFPADAATSRVSGLPLGAARLFRPTRISEEFLCAQVLMAKGIAPLPENPPDFSPEINPVFVTKFSEGWSRP
jgi:hypothetical protein